MVYALWILSCMSPAFSSCILCRRAAGERLSDGGQGPAGGRRPGGRRAGVRGAGRSAPADGRPDNMGRSKRARGPCAEVHSVRTHNDCHCSQELDACYNRAEAVLLEATGQGVVPPSHGAFVKITLTPSASPAAAPDQALQRAQSFHVQGRKTP